MSFENRTFVERMYVLSSINCDPIPSMRVFSGFRLFVSRISKDGMNCELVLFYYLIYSLKNCLVFYSFIIEKFPQMLLGQLALNFIPKDAAFPYCMPYVSVESIEFCCVLVVLHEFLWVRLIYIVLP